ncbi:nuclear transport factor 2 family protein [Amycolatopsis panacis]|uniref:Nuclear transport factor 2 family protein n=1 Tax=Amycolatopsis panacis TaxID=2340917 RepID=A0A419I6E0_9PSEU|nr:nuclear transport factor 2 family protein [Amycolatopsis panacis]RJQ86841.1 nuclear transport factor 2 family protein [Amycolatopsis panacis]
MSQAVQAVGSAEDIALYVEVQQFYGRQMRYLDEGRVQEWAKTFTEDGVFAANAHPEPARGRTAIEAGALEAATRLTEQGIQRRHWLGMVQVDPQPDGSIVAKSYAVIIGTPLGGRAAVDLSCDCVDVLVREGGALLVRERQVYRDDLPRN